MTENEADLMTLLRRLDDPEWLEWPRDYSSSEASVPFGRLVSRPPVSDSAVAAVARRSASRRWTIRSRDPP